MKKLVSKLVERHGSSLCTLVTVVAPVAVNNCRSRLYQPKEPEGLEDFVLAHKKKM
ncbi:MAG: cyclic lactone autoinducer peptide [Coprococcus sp.]|nr:cyclic lactone autoinducer peptide [Coprococcus sp.]